MDKNQLLRYLTELGLIYKQLHGEPLQLGVCGGAGLILMDLIDRATKDIDTLFPVEWPAKLKEAVQIVARNFGLPEFWMNSGPDMITTMGLPDGFKDRAKTMLFGESLTVYFASRYDQIFFKVYASVDRPGSYHVDDLLALHPTTDEMLAAARWCCSHDVSEGFLMQLKDMLEKLGYGEAAKQLQ